MSKTRHPGKVEASVTPLAGKPVGPLTPGLLPRESGATPLALRTITKLDQRSMVWADDGMATQMEAMGPWIAFTMLVPAYGIGWMLFHLGHDLAKESLGTAIGIYSATIFGIVVCIGIAIYSLEVSLFNTYADLHFNRKEGKVYTALNNQPFVMDWRNVQPMAGLTIGPIQLGAPPLMSLVLAETMQGNPGAILRKLTVAGPLPNREACQQVWELIRRYMDGTPDDLPPQVVVPGGRSWQTVLVTCSPQAQRQGATEYLQTLRANGWHVRFNPIWLLVNLLFWVDPVSNLLYAKYRRKARLPTDLVATEAVPPSEPNPYRTSATDPTEAAGMRHAARVIGITLAITSTIGITLWVWFAVAIIRAL